MALTKATQNVIAPTIGNVSTSANNTFTGINNSFNYDITINGTPYGAGATGGGNGNVFIGGGGAVANNGNNVGIGLSALGSCSGFLNTAIGAGSLSLVTSQTNVTGLGSSSEITANNQVQLGSSSTTTYAYGSVQNRSDIRDKSDVRDTELGLEFVNSLRPVDFKWDMREDYRPEAPKPLNQDATEEEKVEYKIAKDKWIEDAKLANITHDGSKKRSRFHHGLIAQEVKSVLDAKGIDFGGFQDHSVKGGDDVLSIGYEELIAPLIKAIQELSAEVAALKAK